jgi:hypothetical protein
MIESYHHSVGNNGVLELDFAIDDTGNVHPNHAAEYKVRKKSGLIAPANVEQSTVSGFLFHFLHSPRLA